MPKVLFVATVVKKHIMEFHLPFLKMFQEHGWQTAVAARPMRLGNCPGHPPIRPPCGSLVDNYRVNS